MPECDNDLCKDCKDCACKKKIKKAEENEARNKLGAFNAKSENWVSFLKRDNFVGGEVECKEDGVVYRGSLASIKEEYGAICLNLSWYAIFIPRTKEWVKYPVASLSILKTAVIPQEADDNKVVFVFPTSKLFIHPNNYRSKLDIKDVKEPPKSSKRLLFLCLELPFDREVVRKICSEMILETPKKSTLREVVSNFPSAEMRAEFLQRYLDAMKKDSQSVKI
jgi:hypothetical protein